MGSESKCSKEFNQLESFQLCTLNNASRIKLIKIFLSLEMACDAMKISLNNIPKKSENIFGTLSGVEKPILSKMNDGLDVTIDQ